jgi:trimethylamine--corrinoid protein Co-methyltransferase
VNLIKEIGPGGSYIVAKHTISRMKTEAVMTKMADRNQRTIWEKKGATDIQTRAMQRVREIMASNTNSLLRAEIDEKLRTQFQDMVSGELVPID